MLPESVILINTPAHPLWNLKNSRGIHLEDHKGTSVREQTPWPLQIVEQATGQPPSRHIEMG